MFAVSLTLTLVQPGTDAVTLSYTSYIKVFKSPLVAVISEGEEREIAFKRGLSDGNATYYDFTITGNESYDPDERMKPDTMLRFNWFCRILSAPVLVNKSRAARINHPNETLDEACKNFTNYADLGEGEPILRLNTVQFLENVTYSIKLEVTKDDRMTVTNQNLTFIPGNPPTMQIK